MKTITVMALREMLQGYDDHLEVKIVKGYDYHGNAELEDLSNLGELTTYYPEEGAKLVKCGKPVFTLE